MAEEARPRGHRWVAAIYDGFNRRSEVTIMRHLRPFVVGEAAGSVLEIGFGTGASLPYYDWTKVRELIATDPDPFMLQRAEKRTRKMGLDSKVRIMPLAAEDLPFDDASFDTVVSTMVLCTVRDVPQSLAEVKRVLKPDGALRFIEHVRHDAGVRGWAQDAFTPVWSWLSAGCHLNRRTAESLTEAGFDLVELRRLAGSPVSPLLVGVAKPA
jgi:ubiquinone/menaquinone biosynthesis C-methylase UbiE